MRERAGRECVTARVEHYDGTNTVSNRVLSEDLAAWSKCDAS